MNKEDEWRAKKYQDYVLRPVPLLTEHMLSQHAGEPPR